LLKDIMIIDWRYKHKRLNLLIVLIY